MTVQDLRFSRSLQKIWRISKKMAVTWEFRNSLFRCMGTLQSAQQSDCQPSPRRTTATGPCSEGGHLGDWTADKKELCWPFERESKRYLHSSLSIGSRSLQDCASIQKLTTSVQSKDLDTTYGEDLCLICTIKLLLFMHQYGLSQLWTI